MNVSETNFPLANTWKVYSRDANLWRSKIWILSFIHSPPPPHHRRNFNIPPPQQIDPAPNGNDLGHYNYEVLHEVYTIKSHNHHFDARNNLCQMASLPI